jgi:hypothetical protein
MSILKKEIGAFTNALPAEVINSLTASLSDNFNDLIEQSGYVHKSKYQVLEDIADRLEKRITFLEETIK